MKTYELTFLPQKNNVYSSLSYPSASPLNAVIVSPADLFFFFDRVLLGSPG
jgi:hypothetical protein